MTGREKKYLAIIRDIFINRYFYIHIGYWIFYILFFTVQRFAFYGYSDFIPNLKLNLAYLPNVLICTYIVTGIVIPNMFNRNKLFLTGSILVLIIVVEPVFAYLVRIFFIEPYIYNDHRVYTLYNYLTAILIFVFGTVPVAGWKIARLLRSHYLHLQKVEHDKLEAELKLKESELKLLKGQIQPHFLFNTLNNIYLLALEKSDKTPDLVLRLSEMLSYITYDCSAEKIPLDKEIEFINSFVELEKIRYETCDIFLKISGNTQNIKIAPMILHTFIDNSFKHGAQQERVGRGIKFNLTVNDNNLTFSAENSKKHENDQPRKAPGIGISNAIKRLNLIYPDRHELIINESVDRYSVFLKIELYENE
jgi:two-component system LytT family sensor kinase